MRDQRSPGSIQAEFAAVKMAGRAISTCDAWLRHAPSIEVSIAPLLGHHLVFELEASS